MWTKLKKNNFISNVSVLITGTAIAQAMTVLSSPILTRLYTPEEIGVLGLYTSIVSILTVIMTLRYELAIVLPNSDKESANVFGLSLMITLIITSILLILIFLFGGYFTNILGVPELSKWLWIAPFSALIIGIYNSFNYWSTRKKQFKRISRSKMVRSSGIVSLQLGLGSIGIGTGGLIGGQLIGELLSSISLGRQIWKNDKKFIISNIDYSLVKKLAKRYSDFPLFSSTQSLVNSISQNFAPFLLGTLFGPTTVGFYAMALKTIQLPANLVGDAFRQVYFQRISELKNHEKVISKHLIKTTFYLFLLGLLPVLIFFIFAPSLFSIIFGREWYVAGEYSRWLVVWLFFWFINRPAISTIQVFGIQKYLLIYEIILLITRTTGLFLVSQMYSALEGVIVYSLIGAILTPIVTISTIFYVRKRENGYFQQN